MPPPAPPPLRRARRDDAPELARLSAELGYPASAAELEARLPALLASPEQLVLVAADGADRAIGLLHAAERRPLHAAPHVQVVALVVAGASRGARVGAALLAAAEAWARERGVGEVRVRSHVARERAHGFYRRAGYEVAKTSLLFAKPIA